MTKVVAYSDAAGQEGASVILEVGTVLATVDQWRQFEVGWKDALDAEGAPYFHFNRIKSRNPPFDGWDDAKRDRLMTELLRVFCETVPFWSTAAVLQDAMRRVGAVYDLEARAGGPFMLAALVAKIQAEEEARSRYPGLALEHVFEEGDRGQRPHLRLREELGFQVKPARDLYPLQAADLVAGELFTFRHGMKKNDERRIGRKSLQKLFRCGRGGMHTFHAYTLLALCEAYPGLFPRRVSAP